MIYIVCFRFIPLANPLATLMSTVGALLLIDEIIVHATVGIPVPYPALFSDVIVNAGPFTLRGDLMFMFALGCLSMLLLLGLLYRTKLGIATRAVSQQPAAAQLCGISIRARQRSDLRHHRRGRRHRRRHDRGRHRRAVAAAVAAADHQGADRHRDRRTGQLYRARSSPVCLVGGFENLFQSFRGVTERDLYVMLLLFAFLVFRPGGIFSPAAGRD